MKKIFSDVELEIILLGEADVIRTSAATESVTSTTHTTDIPSTDDIDNEDDLPWDTMQ